MSPSPIDCLLRAGAIHVAPAVRDLHYYGFQTPLGPVFLAITSSDLAQLVPNFQTLLFSPSANFCQYDLLIKNR